MDLPSPLRYPLYDYCRLILGVLVLPLQVSQAQPGVSPERIEQIQALADGYAETFGFNGALLVGWGDEVVLRRAYGMANFEFDIPNTPTTRFRLASLSKQFTAAAILVLEQQGLVDLLEPVSTYLPQLNPEISKVVTLHHLLSHSSGLVRDIEELTDDDLAGRHVPLAEIIDLISTSDLRFEPGSRWSYSNPGYAVAAAVIESVTKASYGDALDQLLFKPLGMNDTGHETAPHLIPNRAGGYVMLPEGLINAPYEDKSYVIGAGSIYSTINDLFVWSRAMLKGTLLNQENQGRLFSRQMNRYSYGWFIDSYVWPPNVGDTSGLSVHHGGDSPGFTCNVSFYVDHDLVVIFLSNVVPSHGTGLYNQAANILLGFDESLPRAPDRDTFYDTLFSKGVSAAFALGQKWIEAGEKYRIPSEDEVYVVGRGYLEAHQYDRAIRIMDLLIQWKPQWTYPYLFKGIALSKTGNQRQAVQLFERVLELDPHQSNAKSWLDKLAK